jgi:hypothetical protein
MQRKLASLRSDALVLGWAAENMPELFVCAFDYSGDLVEDETAHEAFMPRSEPFLPSFGKSIPGVAQRGAIGKIFSKC